MIKIKQGWIGDPKTGTRHDIIVKAVSPNTLKDALIGGSLILIGVAYLTATAFKNGVEKFDDAQFKILHDLDLLEEVKP